MRTPAPWANVIANETFGTVVTDGGLGFTWNGNSQTNRLTPWHNDPVSDPQSEVIYVRDEQTGNCSARLPSLYAIHSRIASGMVRAIRATSTTERASRRNSRFSSRGTTRQNLSLRLRNDSKRSRLSDGHVLCGLGSGIYARTTAGSHLNILCLRIQAR